MTSLTSSSDPVIPVTLDNLGSLLNDSSSDDDNNDDGDVENKKKKKNPKNKKKNKNKTKKETNTNTHSSPHPTQPTTITASDHTTPISSTTQHDALTSSSAQHHHSNKTITSSALLQQQRRVQFLTQAYKHATIEARKFKQSLENSTSEQQNEMIEKLQIKRNNTFIDVDVLEGSKDTTARAIAFAVDDLHAITVAHVFVNLFGTIVEQDFRIQFIAPQDGITENIGVTAYKYGTSEQSAIQQHIAPLAQVTKTANGTVVAITFQEGQMIQSFTVEGSKTTLQEKSVGQTTSTYTFPVEDLKQLVTATVKIAAGSYSAEYPLQFRFDVKGAPTIVENPFTDIETDGNKDAILTLYAKGIITKAEHFYPQNNVTRGQLALMIARALQLSDAPDAGFKDVVTLSDTEQIQAINALAAAGIVMTGENFKPNDIITRQQGALMVYRAISYVAQKELDFGSTLVYADEASISNVEARKAFALLYAGGMMTGRKNTAGALVIEPNTQLKRTQMAKILNGALKYMSTK